MAPLRLGITFPEVTKMQTRAILEAAIAVQKGASAEQLSIVFPQIMIPLVVGRCSHPS